MSIDKINAEFYNNNEEAFDKIPFDPLLPEILKRHFLGRRVLEIGSGGGALALWLKENCNCSLVLCEPAEKLALKARSKGLDVHTSSIQNFQSDEKFDSALAISSLIHVPKEELPAVIHKIHGLLEDKGLFVVSFIEGTGDGFEDPTKAGRDRYFALYTEAELAPLFSPHFNELETHRIFNKKMNRHFLLKVFKRN
ncbi:class I SAM-dependent methyltransferase [Estrella lausannensis]|uniref:Putative methyltransferase n=1 Tax=Estrella lausannensis TaxID=483423 RepID=A0A0H5DPI5_9BACT|nr:class I SAM-dependent methyltransferase [Estrella lausannensis]CRX37908.1 Putative methyltransferase [Estrella lausannensis]